jgi:putative serine protease PepD
MPARPSSGSGFIIDAQGHILTNNHVVRDANEITVTLNDKRTFKARLVGADPETDVAVIKVEGKDLPVLPLGDSERIRVGDWAIAIGNPLGELQGSVTAGIVSALHRTISVGDDNGSPFGRSNTPPTRIGDAIQTDAPINPGNSGGALVNMNGELVGINSAIATAGSNGNIGVGFAISANRAKAVVDQLIKGQPVSHPYLGVSIQNAENGGALIGQVEPGSPADQAGLEVGDVVTKVGDRGIASGDDLVGAIQTSTVGEALTMTVVRNGAEQTLTATVGEQP